MQVKDIMIEDVRTVQPEDSVRKAATIICTNKISGLPVVDGENNLVGIISEKDILKSLLPSFTDFLDDPIRARDFEGMEEAYQELLSKSVKALKTKQPYTVNADDPVLLAASRMHLHGFRRIPVVDGTQLVGIISLGDIHKAIFKRELGVS